MTYVPSRAFDSSLGRIAWDVAGDGDTPVILIHGTPAHSVVWQAVVARLTERYRIYTLDLPGYGASDKFEGQEVRLRSFARALREFIHDQGLEGAHLVGHDFGAATVMGCHLVENVDVAGIVVADGVLLSPWGTPYSRHVRDHEAVFAAVPEYIHRATLSAHLDTAVARAMPAGMKEALIRPWTGEAGQQAYYRQVGQYDYAYTETLEELYPRIRVPVSVLWGEADRWVAPAEGRRFHAMIAHADWITLPDAGHFSMLDCPGLFARELDAALIRAQAA